MDLQTETAASDSTVDGPDDSVPKRHPCKMINPFSRDTFVGAILFNFLTSLIPAVYSTLSKLWIAQIDGSLVATTDVYTYLGVITEILNEGLPRASFLVIGDTNIPLKKRILATQTLIISQTVCGFVLSVVYLVAAPSLANAFAPAETVQQSITYIRISSFSTLFSVAEYSMSCSLKALDRPDVPLVISTTKTVLNIVLDLAFLSTIRIFDSPSINTQAFIRLACDGLGALAGVVYFLLTIHDRPRFSFALLKRFALPGSWTLLESAVRNVLYLWLIAGIVALGSEYATAWGVFNTIRWGIVMVPATAFSDASATYTGHAWSRSGRFTSQTSLRQLKSVVSYAIVAAVCVLAVETLVAVVFSLWLVEPFAFYLSGNASVASLTARMWSTMDWTYVLYAVGLQLGTILIATWPAWYLLKTLLSNLFWVLPWAIAMQVLNVTADNAWTYHSIIFGGSLVVDLIVVIASLMLWAYALCHFQKFQAFKSWFVRVISLEKCRSGN